MSQEGTEQWLQFEYRWRVKKEDIRMKAFHEYIWSPKFAIIKNGLRYQWQLLLYPKGKKTEEFPTADTQPNMALALSFRKGGIQSAVEAKFKIEVVGAEEKSRGPVMFNTLWDTEPSKGKVPGWRIDNLYPHQELDNVGSAVEVEFNVKIGMREWEFDLHHIFPNPLLHNCPKGLLFYKLTVLGDQKRNQDLGVVILAAGTERIHCHQIMLMESSPVFEAMFASENQESQTREVSIPDISAHTIKQLLYFFYVEALPDGWKENVPALLYAAHKYDVKSLELLCEKEMVAQLSLETAVESLVMAKQMDLCLLEMKATHFLLDHWAVLPEQEKEGLKQQNAFMSLVDVSNLDKTMEILS